MFDCGLCEHSLRFPVNLVFVGGPPEVLFGFCKLFNKSAAVVKAKAKK